MKKLPPVLLALSLVSAASLFAQVTTITSPGETRGSRRGGPGGPGGFGRGGHPLVRAIDTDKNGELSATEISSAPASLRALDANADGSVSKDELRPVRSANAPARPADAPATSSDGETRKGGRPHSHGRGVDPVMLALDADTDSSLSAAEISAAATSLLALDSNKDGKLTSDELRPLPPTN